MGGAPTVSAALGGLRLVGLAPFATRPVVDESRLPLAAEDRVGFWDDRLGEGLEGPGLSLGLRATVFFETDVPGCLPEALLPRRLSLSADACVVRVLLAEVFWGLNLAVAFACLALAALMATES